MANVSAWCNTGDELYNGTTITANVNDRNISVNETTVRVDLLSTEGVQKDALFVPWNNPDNLISFETYTVIRTIVNCGLDPILFFTGVPANIISCLVFYKQGLRDRMNLCLFVLALVDTLHVVSVNVAGFQCFIRIWDPELAQFYYAVNLARFVFFLSAMRVVSGCISMVVAVERCVCVVFPLRANSIMRTRTMGAILAAIIVIALLGYSMLIFRSEIVTVADKISGGVRHVIVNNSHFQRRPLSVLFDIVHDLILSFGMPIINFVVVGVATVITVIRLRKAMAWRASTSSGRADNHSQQQQVALTKMLVILSCVFITCSAPVTAFSIVSLLVPGFSHTGRYSNLIYASYTMGYFLVALNSSVNFFVYYFRSTRFRQDVKSLFRRLCRKELISVK